MGSAYSRPGIGGGALRVNSLLDGPAHKRMRTIMDIIGTDPKLASISIRSTVQTTADQKRRVVIERREISKSIIGTKTPPQMCPA
jgi:hypothetical protein